MSKEWGGVYILNNIYDKWSASVLIIKKYNVYYILNINILKGYKNEKNEKNNSEMH